MRFIISVFSTSVPTRRKPAGGRNLLKSSGIIKQTRRRLSRHKRDKSLFAHLPIWPLSSVLYQRAAII
jgi:hypothetical protein